MTNVPARRFLHPPRTAGRFLSRAWNLGHPEYQRHAPPSGAAFIYGVARNPWDRVVSLWHWDEEGKDGYDRDFERWVLNGITTYSTGSGFLVCRPCSWWLHPLQAGRWKDRPDIVGDRGLRDADFVVRFEHMEEDLTTLSQLLDRPMPDLSRPVGQSVRRPYQEYHTPATRAWVEEYYHEDISLYGYQF